MNILYHHRTAAGGACGHHIREVVKAFKKLGYEVDIVAPPGVEDSRIAKTGAQKKGRYKVPQILFELLELGYNGVALVKILRQLRRKKYDFIYERYAIFNIAGVLAARLCKIPVVIESSFTSKTPVFPPRTRLLSPLAYFADRLLFRAVDGIVVVSTVLKENMVDYFGVSPEKILVLPNAVDPDEFDPDVSCEAVKKKHALNGQKVIGFVGGFYPWHGLDILLDSAENVLKALPDVKYLIIGDGPERDKLVTRIKASDRLGKSVILTGSVPHSELQPYLASFDVGVMPDSNDYGSPMKIFEYMAMGKPVLAPRLRPIEEVIADRVNGILFTPKSHEEMARCLIELLSDTELYNRLASRARKQVVEKHTWIGHAQAVTALLQKNVNNLN